MAIRTVKTVSAQYVGHGVWCAKEGVGHISYIVVTEEVISKKSELFLV